MKTVILLIDFFGHPIFGGEYINTKRYIEIQKILTNTRIDKSKLVFAVGGGWEDPKLCELERMAKNLDFKFHQYPKDTTFDQLKEQLWLKCNFEMDTKDTQIIVGGCNTGGCVIKASKPMCAIDSYIKGYETTIYLPMCAEYEQPGINDTERSMMGFAEVYKQIRDYKAFKIRIETDFNALNIPMRIKENTKEVMTRVYSVEPGANGDAV
mgnify:FL=1